MMWTGADSYYVSREDGPVPATPVIKSGVNSLSQGAACHRSGMEMLTTTHL